VSRREIWSQFQFDSVKVGGGGGGDEGGVVVVDEEVVLGARQDKRRHFLAKSTRVRAQPKNIFCWVARSKESVKMSLCYFPLKMCNYYIVVVLNLI
jgi:hypothetical protein